MKAAEMLEVEDQWLLTDGVAALGPISFESVRRAVAQGKVSTDACVRHTSWNVWRAARDISELSATHRQEAVQNLAAICAGVEARATSGSGTPPPPPDASALDALPPESERPVRSSLRPLCIDPVGLLAATQDLEDAMLLTLSTAAATARADVGLLHRARPDLGTLVTSGGHGPGVEHLLGEALRDGDASVGAAERGLTVIAEPQPGEVGRYLLGRLGRCLVRPRGAVMVPLVVSAQLLATFEFGRSDRPFLVREVARIEDVVEALAERALVMGWLDG